jgi:hypothetical protein
MVAVVGAAIGPALGADVDDVRFQWMHGDGPDGRRFGKPAGHKLPLAVVIAHPIQPGLDHPARRGFAGEANVDVGSFHRCSHDLSSFSGKNESPDLR